MRSREEVFTSGRLSGRTSRMLLQALIFQKQGKAVYVLCAHKQSIMHTARLLGQICDKLNRPVPLDIKFETWDSIGRNQVDFENCRIRASHQNCQLLIDHHFYEHHFSFALYGYHQWDARDEGSEHWNEKDWDFK